MYMHVIYKHHHCLCMYVHVIYKHHHCLYMYMHVIAHVHACNNLVAVGCFLCNTLIHKLLNSFKPKDTPNYLLIKTNLMWSTIEHSHVPFL